MHVSKHPMGQRLKFRRTKQTPPKYSVHTDVLLGLLEKVLLLLPTAACAQMPAFTPLSPAAALLLPPRLSRSATPATSGMSTVVG